MILRAISAKSQGPDRQWDAPPPSTSMMAGAPASTMSKAITGNSGRAARNCRISVKASSSRGRRSTTAARYFPSMILDVSGLFSLFARSLCFRWASPLDSSAMNPSSLRQLPRVAARAVEPRVRFLVADETPVLRVPEQLAAVPVSEVREMTNGHAARADLNISHRPLARADAIEPVAVMARRSEEVQVLFAERLFDDAFRLGSQLAAIDVKFAFGALERASARSAVKHLNAVRVNELHARVRLRVVRREDIV